MTQSIERASLTWQLSSPELLPVLFVMPGCEALSMCGSSGGELFGASIYYAEYSNAWSLGADAQR